MQRLKVNRHRPCLYRHYYLAVGFIVDKPCQTEVFQPIFCSYTAWITKNVRFGTSSSHFFPVSTGRFLICLKYHAYSIRVELFARGEYYYTFGSPNCMYQIAVAWIQLSSMEPIKHDHYTIVSCFIFYAIKWDIRPDRVAE